MKFKYMDGHIYIDEEANFDIEEFEKIVRPIGGGNINLTIGHFEDSNILMKLTYYKNGMLMKETPDGICTISGPHDEFKEI